MLNKHQKLNTGLQWSEKKRKKLQNRQQWRAGSLKRSADLSHTFAPNNTECQQMYGSVGKYEKTKKSWKRPRSLC